MVTLLSPIQLGGPPTLDDTKIPESERPAFEHIVHLLQHLGIHAENFHMALQLYDFCESEINDFFQKMIGVAAASGKLDQNMLVGNMPALGQRFSVLGGWQEIATRDGALSIYHFGSILDGIKMNCPGFLGGWLV